MKKAKTLIVCTSLLLGSFFYAGAQGTTELEEVAITCKTHTWDLQFSLGIISMTWHFSTIKCDNGFENIIMI